MTTHAVDPDGDDLRGVVADLVARMNLTEAENRRVSDENRRLTDEVRALRGAAIPGGSLVSTVSGEGTGHALVDPGDHAVSRRGLLLGGATAAAVAGAIAVVGAASPAAANNGDALVAGSVVTGATASTGVHASLPGEPVGRFLNEASTGDGFWGQGGGSGGGCGVRGVSSSGVGVVGQSTSSVGASGGSDTGDGVHGTSDSATGVQGNSNSGTGVAGETVSGPFGVQGYSPTHTGVRGDTQSGIAVSAAAVSGSGVFGFSDSGDGVSGASTSGVGLTASAPTHLRLHPRAAGAPTADAFLHERGDLVEDSGGNLWLCTQGGTPGKWRKLAGPATAGAFHVLAAPVRIYDSRPGLSPPVGPKTPLNPNGTRTLDLTVNNSGVPKGASAAMVNLLVVNAVAGNGNFTIWANGVNKPAANTMVWGGSTGRFCSQAVTAVDATAKCAVSCSVQTDIVIDVAGYYL